LFSQMRIFIYPILVFLFFSISACNLPGKSRQNSDPTAESQVNTPDSTSNQKVDRNEQDTFGSWVLMNRHTTGENTLHTNFIQASCIDANGRILCKTGGTRDYLSIYDGHSWSYDDAEKLFPGLDERMIFYGDRVGDVWINSGTRLYKYSNNNLYEIKGLKEVASKFERISIKNIKEDIYGALWFHVNRNVFTYDGLRWKKHNLDFLDKKVQCLFMDLKRNANVYNGEKLLKWKGGRWVEWENQFIGEEFEKREIVEFFMDSNGRYWANVKGQGYYLNEGYEWVKVLDRNYEFMGQPLGQKTIYEDFDGNIWISLIHRVVKYDGASFQDIDFGTEHKLVYFEILFPEDRTIWVSSTNGFFVFDGVEWKNITSDGVPNDIAAICEAPDNSVYMITRREIFQLRDGIVEPRSEKLLNKPRELAFDQVGSLIVGHEYFYKMNFTDHSKDTFPFYQFNAFDIVFRNNSFLICNPSGIYSVKDYIPQTYVNHPAMCMVEYKGQLLFGANYVLNEDIKLYPYCNDTSQKTLPAVNKEYTNYIRDMEVDNSGNLWCTTVEGISRFDGEKWVTYHNGPDQIVDETFNPYGTFQKIYEHIDVPIPSFRKDSGWERIPIAVDKIGNVWFAFQSMIIKYDGTKFHKVDTGIPEKPTILDIMPMSDGSIWFTTSRDGILKYIP